MTDESDFVVLTNKGYFRILIHKDKLTLYIAENIGEYIQQVKRNNIIVLEPSMNNILGCVLETSNKRSFEVRAVYKRIA